MYKRQVLRDAMMAVGGPDAFVGHVGGDDFVLLTQFGREHLSLIHISEPTRPY